VPSLVSHPFSHVAIALMPCAGRSAAPGKHTQTEGNSPARIYVACYECAMSAVCRQDRECPQRAGFPTPSSCVVSPMVSPRHLLENTHQAWPTDSPISLLLLNLLVVDLVVTLLVLIDLLERNAHGHFPVGHRSHGHYLHAHTTSNSSGVVDVIVRVRVRRRRRRHFLLLLLLRARQDPPRRDPELAKGIHRPPEPKS